MYKIKNGIEIEFVDDEVIILDTVDGRVINVNKSGFYIIQKIQNKKSSIEIAKEISNKFKKDFDIIINMVNEFIAELTELKLIEKCEE